MQNRVTDVFKCADILKGRYDEKILVVEVLNGILVFSKRDLVKKIDWKTEGGLKTIKPVALGTTHVCTPAVEQSAVKTSELSTKNLEIPVVGTKRTVEEKIPIEKRVVVDVPPKIDEIKVEPKLDMELKSEITWMCTVEGGDYLLLQSFKTFFAYKRVNGKYVIHFTHPPKKIDFSRENVNYSDITGRITRNGSYAVFSLADRCELYKCKDCKKLIAFSAMTGTVKSSVVSMFPNDFNLICVGTTDGGVSVYRADKNFLNVKIPSKVGGPVASLLFSPTTAKDADSPFFVISRNGRITKLQYNKKSEPQNTISMIGNEVDLKVENVKDAFLSSNGKIIYIVYEKGIKEVQLDTSKQRVIEVNNIVAACVNNKGVVVVVNSEGVFKVQEKDLSLIRVNMQMDKADVTYVVADKEGNFVFSTKTGKVFTTTIN
ncbi:hypothetical protein EIN_025260 [Entamoeba invadens IP1]|uniref:hypothetical protein n=1 Tax=Entamoeba invadens IP1 TaxID=370355 RepID=UPI0002C3F875|nr:hypothetical protein EIN_025260 [Entamoeba invadens IP1]ELP90717.1 hypothetical protein EIN_025260 [Entamoeba invadens IP1]|eukprot:XP_004257488.1 hypothetical protein EIN_025260 [Entamoeba invadens IP1]